MTELHFKKGNMVLYLDNKAKIISANKKDWCYTIQTLKDGRTFNCSPSQLASYIYGDD